jgi:putative sigma-54 modulation protein
MKVSITGKQGQFTPDQEKKLKARYDKLAKLLDGRGEREARIVVTQERHLYHAEITVNYRDNALVSVAGNTDLFIAIGEAVEKLEKQVLKFRSKRRETHRVVKNKEGWAAAAEPEVVETIVDDEAVTRTVFRGNHTDGRKPMTLDEALLEMENDRDYMVYQDADTQKTTVVVRRRDGNFELIES